ncbi:saccharopine dehydrogenase NADP-binding domain-containing protein [Maritalea mediterranea]|uniref:Saccharopine dehydrogenase NADP-binding domain-containing protein n=1 Tax=Maritalea mediterranea TaxID=2909667 RepID=A0ABS9E537_9HYPH|nr:saccharopine dehydrogenase NADP-binding domain-containing protein [Maritalea mediterranea]MCF4097374.1 saccharopine dehydrogenase NADP-binding domain-containing protein [Maritalea mediterranea]
MARYWIIGGYGEVGAAATRRLHATAQHEDEILVAGRGGEKAAELAQKLGKPVRAFELDVTGPVRPKIFEPGDIIINTVEAISKDWLISMAEMGVIFIDVSATDGYLNRVRTIFSGHPDKSLCLTDVGTSPGLTNLMAAHMAAKFPKLVSIETYIEMGMGKHHGQAATKWVFEALSTTYPIEKNGARHMVHPRDQITKASFDLPTERQVTAVGVGFSDQVTIAQRHNLQTAQTFVSVAPNWINQVIGALLRLPLSRLIHRHAGTLASLMGKLPPLGPIRTSLKTVASDQAGQIMGSIEMLGPDQSELTGDIAAMAALRLRRSGQKGVRSLPDVMKLSQIRQQLSHLKWHESL